MLYYIICLAAFPQLHFYLVQDVERPCEARWFVSFLKMKNLVQYYAKAKESTPIHYYEHLKQVYVKN